jgi:hypothetical protein
MMKVFLLMIIFAGPNTGKTILYEVDNTRICDEWKKLLQFSFEDRVKIDCFEAEFYKATD